MAEIIFNPSLGLDIPSSEEVRKDLGEKLQNCFKVNPTDPLLNIEPSSPMGQFLDLVVAEIEAKNTEIAFLANMTNPNTSTGKYLDALAALYGIDRKISEATVVNCTVYGLKGTLIPYGAIVQDDQGNQFRHNAAAGVLIDASGEAETTFSAIDHGSLEVGPGSITQIVTTIAGWDRVENKTAGIVGRDEETDSELRNRMIESYAVNATGYVESIQSNIQELEGVLDCRVLENYNNEPITLFAVNIEPHSVLIAVVGGDDVEIARTIYERKDAGCGTTGDYEVKYTDREFYNATYVYKIVRPQTKEFKVKVEFFNKTMDAEEKQQIINAVINDFLGKGVNDRVSLASTIYASRFFNAVQSATNSPLKNITIALEGGEFSSIVEVPANIAPTIVEDDVEIILGG